MLNLSTPIAVTGGEILGTQSQYEDVIVYKGIPYAAPPIGNLRWKAPQPVIPWNGVKECTDWGYSAIQPKQAPFMMWSKEFIIEDTGYSEDCLTLNVWAKENNELKKPVLVYIHGGGFTSGGSSCEVYDGAYMAKHDVIYVSINYRVGVLGYLAHPDLTKEAGTSGNYGILDMIQALKWVKENIEQFGGDSDDVTIMGQSAGSASVHELIASPLAKGLFTKAVAESFNPYSFPLKTLSQAEHNVYENRTIEELRAMSAEDLLNEENNFQPIIDGTVLPTDYATACKNDTINPVTLLTGFVTGDILLFNQIPMNTKTLNEANLLASTILQKDVSLEQYYNADNLQQLIAGFNIDYTQAEIDLLAHTRKQPTYAYYFTHTMPGEQAEQFGAFHTADVPYFLGILSKERASYWTKDDETLRDTMSASLLAFVKTGSPSCDKLPQWTMNTDGEFMILDTQCSMAKLSDDKKELFSTILHR